MSENNSNLPKPPSEGEKPQEKKVVLPKKEVKRDGPKYICPYCKTHYYLKNQGEACRDKCHALLEEGKDLPEKGHSKLDFTELLDKINTKGKSQ